MGAKKNINHCDIFATSDRGNYFSGAVIVLLWVLLGLCVSIFLLLIVIAVIYTPKVFDYWVFVPVVSAIAGSVYSLYYIAKMRVHRKEIEEALTDAVLIEAYIGKTDVGSARSLLRNGICLAVTFSYNNEKRVMVCGRYVKDKLKALHFRRFGYCDKYIKVLYSPKFNRILFLKNTMEQKQGKEIEF